MKVLFNRIKISIFWLLSFFVIFMLLFLKLEHFSLLSEIPVDFSQTEFEQYQYIALIAATVAILKALSYLFFTPTRIHCYILLIICGLLLFDGFLYLLDAEPYALQFNLAVTLMKQMQRMALYEILCATIVFIPTLLVCVSKKAV